MAISPQLIVYGFKNILDVAVQCFADFKKHIRCNIGPLAEFRNGRSANTGGFLQIHLGYILVNQHLLYFPVSTVEHMEDTYVNMYAISHIEYQEKMCTIHFLDHTHLNCKNPKQIEKTYFYSRQYALHF